MGYGETTPAGRLACEMSKQSYKNCPCVQRPRLTTLGVDPTVPGGFCGREHPVDQTPTPADAGAQTPVGRELSAPRPPQSGPRAGLDEVGIPHPSPGG